MLSDIEAQHFFLTAGPQTDGVLEDIEDDQHHDADPYNYRNHTQALDAQKMHAATYRQLQPVYDRYRQSRDKEKFLRGHESEIILFEAAARELKKLGAVPVPSAERMKKELAALTVKKDELLAEYRTARSEVQEYETIKKNVDTLLHGSEEKEQSKVYELT